MSGRVAVELSGDKIVARSHYYPGAADDAKTIPGGKWNPAIRAWEYPLSLLTCRTLRRVYGDNLRVGSKLDKWAKVTAVRERKQIRTGKATKAELTVLPKMFPETYRKMQNRPYQITGTRFAADGRTVALLDEVGLGKTVISIAGTIEAGNWAGDHLVIAKKTALESVWGNQLGEWTDGQAATFVVEGTKTKRQKVVAEYLASTAESKWLIINSAMLRTKKELWCSKCKKWEKEISDAEDAPMEDLDHWTMAHKAVNKISLQSYPELQTVAWRAIIADEAHEYMSTAIKSKHNTTQEAAGLLSLKTTKDCVRLALSGTPERGRELNLWGIMHWLDPKKFSSKWAWVDHFFEKEENFFGFEIGPLRKEMRREFWRMLEVQALRRTRAEVRPDIAAALPPVIEWVPLEGRHRKQYEELVDLGRVTLKGGELQTQSFMAEFVRQQQLAWGEWEVDSSGRMIPTARSPKLARLLDMLEERGINAKGRGDFKVSQRHFKYIVASRLTH
jgi:SNF2 family DNA or RNA helicase